MNKRIDDATRPDLTALTSGYKLLVDSTANGTKKIDLDIVSNVDNHVNGTTNKVFTATEQTKLSGIATGAEVNVNADWTSSSGDSQILNKPTLGTIVSLNYWTGTQAAYDLLTPDSNTLYIIIG